MKNIENIFELCSIFDIKTVKTFTKLTDNDIILDIEDIKELISICEIYDVKCMFMVCELESQNVLEVYIISNGYKIGIRL